MSKAVNSGLILLNKKPGITSFDSLRDVKRNLGTGKVGHTGTLDKFASGLLVILAGRALKLSRWFSHCDKKYKGRIHFGIETDTLDPEGETIAEAAIPSRDAVEQVLSQFTGEILQEPPVFSAIHINGQRASNLARSGQTPQMKKRPVCIYQLELKSWEPPFADIFVHCSSGTYIRSLARDIAIAAGSRAFLCELERTQVAGFCLGFNLAKAQGRKEEDGDSLSSLYPIHPIDKTVISTLGMPWFEVSEQEAEDIFHGKMLDTILKSKSLFPSASSAPLRLCENSYQEEKAASLFCKEMLVAVIERENGVWKYGCVL